MGNTTAMRVHAEFEGGNLGSIEIVSPAHIRFTARADTSPRPLWFYFCIAGARVPSVRCELLNADNCFGPRSAWSLARPVFSPDGYRWRRLEKVYYTPGANTPGVFGFTVPVAGPTTFVAYAHPYTTADLQSLLRQVTSRPGVRHTLLAASGEGRPLSLLTIGDLRRARASVWILARQHAGESPASHAMEGVLRRLAEASGDAAQQVLFQVVPLIDLDGVFHGRYGKDQLPVDFNRDWRAQPTLPETGAILQAMREIHVQHPIQLVLDIHASHHGDTDCYLFGERRNVDDSDIPGSPNRNLERRLLSLIAKYGPAQVGFRETDLRISPAPPNSARGFLARAFGCPAYTVEMSYHLSQSGRYLTEADHREFGVALAEALLTLFSSS